MKIVRVMGSLGLTSFILMIFSIIMLSVASSVVDPSVEVTLGSAAGVTSFLISFITSIVILSTNFHNMEVNQSKILWGILSMLLLGPIGIIIFASVNFKKTPDKYIPMQSTYNTQSLQPDNANNKKTQENTIHDDKVKLENIQKAFKMFEQGQINKEEFEEIKKRNL